jgi:transposase
MVNKLLKRGSFLGISGKPIDISVEELKEALFELGGRATLVAKKLGCTYMTVYRMIDEYEELKEARKDASRGQAHKEVDLAYDVLEMVLEAAEGSPELALKAAQTVLKSSKMSRLYSEQEKDATSSQETLSHLMSISRENALLKEKIAKLESARE